MKQNLRIGVFKSDLKIEDLQKAFLVPWEKNKLEKSMKLIEAHKQDNYHFLCLIFFLPYWGLNSWPHTERLKVTHKSIVPPQVSWSTNVYWLDLGRTSIILHVSLEKIARKIYWSNKTILLDLLQHGDQQFHSLKCVSKGGRERSLFIGFWSLDWAILKWTLLEGNR